VARHSSSITALLWKRKELREVNVAGGEHLFNPPSSTFAIEPKKYSGASAVRLYCTRRSAAGVWNRYRYNGRKGKWIYRG